MQDPVQATGSDLLLQQPEIQVHQGSSSSLSRVVGDDANMQEMKEPCETIFVGSSRRRYVISSKHLNHPLLNALIQKSKQEPGPDPDPDLSVKCEVVLFDHLLWMLENADPNLISSDSLEELAELYVY
ncbi:UNVERIFIED_CONTAM: Auxin-responsive protein SAUR76 [Sesamum latifolium]|uniref:Auxin-responsive protein SAUR76 n=1 Tax=Sesamum latifolium TaxID=2727402 RepID=A0AAW2WP54_9LAMI